MYNFCWLMPASPTWNMIDVLVTLFVLQTFKAQREQRKHKAAEKKQQKMAKIYDTTVYIYLLPHFSLLVVVH